jgi:hypothetical protein
VNMAIPIILDTDMGPDVDDAGALALLHILARRKPVRLLAVTHCTSNPYGCGCISAINTAYGQPDVPIGTWEEPGFLNDGLLYNRFLAEHYPNRFQKSPCTSGAGRILEEALSSVEDHSAVLTAIGPLNNIGRFLSSARGRELAGRKLKQVAAMAGGLERPEWNVQMDIPAARKTFSALEELGVPVVLSPYETGLPIITGRSWGNLPPEHPVSKAYSLYSPQGRPSWDLTAVWAAIQGPEPFFTLSEPGRITVEADGFTRFSPLPQGNVRLLLNREDPARTGAYFDSLWEV